MQVVHIEVPSQWWNLLWPIWLGVARSLDVQMLQKGRTVRLTLHFMLLFLGCMFTFYLTGYTTMGMGSGTVKGWFPSLVGVMMMLFLVAIMGVSQGSARAAGALSKRSKTAQAIRLCESMCEQGQMDHSTLETMRNLLNEETAQGQDATKDGKGNVEQSKLTLDGLTRADGIGNPMAARNRIKQQDRQQDVLLPSDEDLDQMIAERRLGQADTSFRNRLNAQPHDMVLHRRYLRFLVVDCRNVLGADKLLRRIHCDRRFKADEVAETVKQVRYWKDVLNYSTPLAP